MIALRTRKSRKKPRVPGGVRVYAIGDIHGRVDLLDALLKRIDIDLEKNPTALAIEVYLGDYVDRGPASREVIDRLVARNRTFRGVFLKGNHESYLAGFTTNPLILDEWRQFGGLETLRSYGIVPSTNRDVGAQEQLASCFRQALPKSHIGFLNNLRLSFTCGDYFFAHAGVRPGIPLAKQREDDLLWIRQDFLLCEDEFSKIIVHGHTPTLDPEVRPNRINIDTGAYATGRLHLFEIRRRSDRFHPSLARMGRSNHSPSTEVTMSDRQATLPTIFGFRIAVFTVACVLGGLAVWILVTEILRPPGIKFTSDSRSAELMYERRDAAMKAAKFGVVRGDLWSEAAFAYGNIVLAQGGKAPNADPMLLERARAVTELALARAPHNSRLWLLLAANSFGFAGFSEKVSASLRMSYYTGSNILSVLPERLLLATHRIGRFKMPIFRN